MHLKPQLTPSHVAVAFAGGVHGVHEAPHVAGLELLTHVLLQAWSPALHENLQAPLSQRTCPFATAAQAFVQLPQWLGEVARSAHWLPHRVAEPLHPLEHAKLEPAGAQ